MLLPYNSSPNNMVSYKRWTLKDSDTTAADVYAALGSPAVFRLRFISYLCLFLYVHVFLT